MTRRVVVLADAGVSTSLPMGREAVLDVALAELGGERDIHWTVLTADPRDTRLRHRVQAMTGAGFARCHTQDEKQARLLQLGAAANGGPSLPADDAAAAMLDAIADADVVFISAAAIPSSSSPDRGYDIAALGAISRAYGVPLLISGQSLISLLRGQQGTHVAAVLAGAELVGVSDRASAELAAQLGVPVERIRVAVDDTAFLTDKPAPDVLEALSLQRGEYVAVTLSGPGNGRANEATTSQLAALLDHIATVTGLQVLLIPHSGSRSGEAGHDDVRHHDTLFQMSTSKRVKLAPLLSGAHAAWLTRGACAVISNRYQPLAFAIPAAIPTVAIATNHDDVACMSGTASLLGMQDWCLSVLGLASGLITEAFDEAWHRRDEISLHLTTSAAALEKAKVQYWEEFRLSIEGHRDGTLATAPSSLTEGFARVPETLIARGSWSSRNQDALSWSETFAAHDEAWRRQLQQATDANHRLIMQAQAERLLSCELANEATQLDEALTVERAAGKSARRLNAHMIEQNDQLRGDFQSISERLSLLETEAPGLRLDAEELAKLRRTKLIRWSACARCSIRGCGAAEGRVPRSPKVCGVARESWGRPRRRHRRGPQPFGAQHGAEDGPFSSSPRAERPACRQRSTMSGRASGLADRGLPADSRRTADRRRALC